MESIEAPRRLPPEPPPALLSVRSLPGLADYRTTWAAMRELTDRRDASTPDELWLCQHPPVFTLGQAGRLSHVHDPGSIPVIASDRGGQVTYHGPGQAIAYLLLDLRRAGLGVRRLVSLLESAVSDVLSTLGIPGVARPDAPGVYVDGAKIASLGLRIRNGCSYHGVALNVAMDLEPFRRIDPCGYAGLRVVQIADFVHGIAVDGTSRALAAAIARQLGRQAVLAGSPGSPEAP